MKSYKAIRHAAILICFSMIFISAANAEDYKMIHIDSVDDSCSRICNIPPLETALARLKEDNDSFQGITSAQLSLDQYNEGWIVSNISYSKEKEQLITTSALVYGDDSGIYGRGVSMPYLPYDDFMDNLVLSLESVKMTAVWEEKYGPYFLWDFDTKCAYYSEYGIIPCTDYTDVFPQWGKPTKKNIPIEEARSFVNQMIFDQYNIDSFDNLPIYEDVRYIISNNTENGGYWLFNYWIKVQFDADNYWTTVFSIQQLADKEFMFIKAIDPEYFSCLLINH